VVDHVKGPKVTSFKYRPKKRIRVKGGHRHFYTRLMIDFIGKPGEERKVEPKKEVVAEVDAKRAEVVEEPKAEKPKKAAPKKEAVKKPAAAKPASKTSTAKKTDSKKSDKK